MSNFFGDIAERFKLLPSLGKQLYKTAESRATAKRLETQLAETQKPVLPKPALPIQGGNLFADIAKQFNLTKPQEFIKPREPIRPRELTQEDKDRAQRVIDTLKEIARTFPREGAGAVLEIIERVKGIPAGSLTITPGAGEILSEEKYGTLGPKVEKFLFGEKPVESLSKQGEDILRGFGVPEPSAKQFGLTTGMVFLGLDLLPPGGKDVIKLLAKTNKVDDVAKILKTLKGVDNAKITDGIVNVIAKTTDEKTIKRLIENLKVGGVPEVPKGTKITFENSRVETFTELGHNVIVKTKNGYLNGEVIKIPQGYKAKNADIRLENGKLFSIDVNNAFEKVRRGTLEVPAIPKELKPLAQEAPILTQARKAVAEGKSAEEFVKGVQSIDTPNVYFHQTNAKIIEKFTAKEVWVAPDDTAFYGKNTIKVFAESKKPFNLEIPQNQALYEKLGGEKNPKTFDELRKMGFDSVIETNGDRAFLYPEQVIPLTKSQLTDIFKKAVGEVKAPSPLATTRDIQAGTKAKPIEAELPPKVLPTELPPTTPLRATETLPLKESGEQYTAKELSSDTLYQKTGITSTAVKEAETIAKDIPTNPTKWNRFSNSIGKFTTSFKEKIVSDWQRVKELKTEGMKLTNELTPYERRKLMAGRQTARLQKTEEVVRKIDKDILDTSKKLKIKDTKLQNEVFDYLKARHAPERNVALGEKAAGITTKEAGEITARLEKSPHAAEIKRIADDLQKFHNETLDILYQGGKPEGVISKELYDLLKTKYKNHIPLQRVMETDDIAEVLSGRGLAVKGTGLKRAVGSEKEVKDIMENIYAARTQAIQRVEKNIVDNETFNFVQEYIKTFPEQELFEIVKPQAIGKTFEGKIITKQLQSPDILQFQRNGNPAYIKINDPRLAVALRGVNREQLPAVMRYISTITRWMSALVTRYICFTNIYKNS